MFQYLQKKGENEINKKEFHLGYKQPQHRLGSRRLRYCPRENQKSKPKIIHLGPKQQSWMNIIVSFPRESKILFKTGENKNQKNS